MTKPMMFVILGITELLIIVSGIMLSIFVFPDKNGGINMPILIAAIVCASTASMAFLFLIARMKKEDSTNTFE